MSYPDNLKYTKDHEWVKVDENKITCIIGITDYAQEKLGDIAYIDIEEDLKAVNFGECFGTIEAVKAVADLNSPVTGNVIEINASLNDDPSVVNTDPYESGWMIKVELSKPDELNELMSADKYVSFIE
ncbi:MAG: glycine cleavage system protein GcvH [Bacteroidetes bacterium]|nr:glycine cleavage system protein GcvH [Bacteroidota bacterium]